MKPSGLIGGIISASLRHRVVVLGLALMLSGFGALKLRNASYDVFPDFAPPQASIQTEAPGLSPEQVELLVTRPIETQALGVPGVATIRSNSIQGLSDITVVFDAAVDVHRARQQLSEAFAGLRGQLPEGVADPSLSPLTSSTGKVMVAGMTSRVVPLDELRTIAEWTVRPRLLAVPGVAQVSIYGGSAKQYQVAVDPARLARFDVSVGDVATAARRALGVRGAGFIDNANQRIVIEADDDASAVDRLSHAVVAQRDAARLTLGEVADVTSGSAAPIGAALIDDRPGVQVIVSSQYGANTVRVAAAVDRAFRDMAAGLASQGVSLRSDVFRPTTFITAAVGNLTNALVIGGALVIAVVFAFLWNVRMAAIALTAIPLSLLAGVIAIQQLGYSLNTMTLGGLGISVGLLVDDAVIVVENVYRRLRLESAAGRPIALADVIADATFEVRSAVVYATLAIALIFVPVLTIKDVAGRLFGPLGLAYILATLASLLTALTVTPVFCSLLIDVRRLPTQEPRMTRWLKRRYEQALRSADRQATWLLAVTAGACLAIFSLVPLLGSSFIPELKEGHYVIEMVLAPGSSLAASQSLGEPLARALLKAPHVRLVSQRTGRAEKAADVYGTNYSEIEVDLEPTGAAGQAASEAAIRTIVGQVPGAAIAVKTFLADRLDEVLSGYTAPLVVQLQGDDLDALDAGAARIAASLSQVEGALNVQQQNPGGVPRLLVKLRQDDLERWGMNPLDVLEAVRTAFEGETVGQVYEAARVFDAVVILSAGLRHSPEAASALLIKAPGGAFVPLHALADIRSASGRYGVLHEGGRRIQIVTAATADADVGAFTARAEARIGSLKLPPGVAVSFRGAAQAQSESANALLTDAALAAFGMVLLLSLTMPRLRNLGLILLNLPFAMVGGVLALFLTSGVASLGALVGFVTLFGITLRNAIMIVAHYDLLTGVEGRPWTLATAIEGAADRLSPILMTTLATALGLAPLALGSGEPGREIEGPMAVVILGGLFSSAILNLLVLPGAALRLGRFARRGAPPR